MEEKETGGAALPQQMYFRDGSPKVPDCADVGMTLRDYFAAQALTGLCANQSITEDLSPKDVSCKAYFIADAMLKERSK